MLKNRIYKIANNPSFYSFWHNGEKIGQDALSFRLYLERHSYFELTSRKYYKTTVTLHKLLPKLSNPAIEHTQLRMNMYKRRQK